MRTLAVIDRASGVVVGLIVAASGVDSETHVYRTPPKGVSVRKGWAWSRDAGFEPPFPLRSKIAAEARAVLDEAQKFETVDAKGPTVGARGMIEVIDDKRAARAVALATGDPALGKALIRSAEFHLVGSPAGDMVFAKAAPGVYHIYLAASADSGGAARVKMIRDGFAWMFIRTDALVCSGEISKTNATCLAMVPNTLGYVLIDSGSGYEYRVTLARWALAYGLDAALSEIRSFGQVDKAGRLEAALRGAR